MSTNGNNGHDGSHGEEPGGSAPDNASKRAEWLASLENLEDCIVNPLRASEAVLYFVALDMVSTTGAPDADRAERWRWAVRGVAELLSGICGRLYPLSPDGGQSS